MTTDTVIGTCFNFMGVYAGREGDTELGAQLGRVWPAHLLYEVLEQFDK
jgi:hypothetical protein